MLKDAVPLKEVRRALVVKLRHHGDVLLSAPVFSALRAAAPHIDIDALVYADTRDMLDGHPAIDRLHVIDRGWKKLSPLAQFGAEWRLLQDLRARRYDLLIHLTEHRRGAWLARLLGPRWAVGPRLPGRGAGWAKSFTHHVGRPLNARRHTVECHLDALRRIGIQPPPEQRAVVLVPGAAATARVAGLLAANGLAAGRFVHIHPASRWQFKCWTDHGWATLIEALAAAGWPTVLTCAPDAAERRLVEAIGARLKVPVVDLGGQLTLKELAALTAQARLFVGVDSAPMHMAAAMGTPVVALFGPSGDAEWGPWGRPRHGRHEVVASAEHRCRPCGIDGCGGGKVADCLVALSAEQVLVPVRQLLGP